MDHGVLLDKLERAVVQGISLDWFRSYLTAREQCVRINGVVRKITQFSVISPVPNKCYCIVCPHNIEQNEGYPLLIQKKSVLQSQNELECC